jgi:hypothetical protein
MAASEVSLQITNAKTMAKVMNINDTPSRPVFDFMKIPPA